jgi:alpha-tubulin suppressor-like RCC1 family protein
VPASDSGNAAPSQSFLSAACKVDLPGQSVKQIACGYEHLLLLTGQSFRAQIQPANQTHLTNIVSTEHGLLLGTGINTDGQLGTGDDLDRHILSPVRILETASHSRIVSIEAGADTSAFMSEDGTVHTFGNSVNLSQAQRTYF